MNNKLGSILASFLIGISLIFSSAQAQEKQLYMSPISSLRPSQLIQYLVPRFSLKHNIRIRPSTTDQPPDIAISSETGASPIFKNDQNIWFIHITSSDPQGYAQKFAQWLTSDIGKRAIENYRSDVGDRFSATFDLVKSSQIDAIPEDISQGRELAAQNCGRCHATDKTNRMKTIGSTPSFGALRTFEDWEIRFEAFFTLNPHPSFTQIEDVTPPFDRKRPPPIEPITLSLEDVDQIIQFVSQIIPADLGMAMQSQ